MTGLERTQRYLVVCGELDPDSTRPDSGVGQCQAEEAETSSAAVSTEEPTAPSEAAGGTSSNSKEKAALPSYVIGRLAHIAIRVRITQH